jgi:hypothetical protein
MRQAHGLPSDNPDEGSARRLGDDRASKGSMKDQLKIDFADRLSAAAAAKQALLDKLRPRPTQIDPLHAERAGMRAAELKTVRAERTAAKALKREAAVEAGLALQRAQTEAEEVALAARRGERKERKALSAAEAKAKRDAKYAARKARK